MSFSHIVMKRSCPEKCKNIGKIFDRNASFLLTWEDDVNIYVRDAILNTNTDVGNRDAANDTSFAHALIFLMLRRNGDDIS
jgi:hypothetical protein